MADDIPVVHWVGGERRVIGKGSYDPETGELTAIIEEPIFQNEVQINTFSIKENN